MTDCIRRLDIFRTDTLSGVSSLDLEEPEQRGEASSSRSPLRLSPFWQWQDLQILSTENVSSLIPFSIRLTGKDKLLFAEGLPWSCGMPSHNGDVTRVVMLSIGEKQVQIENRLELPGQGKIGVCCPKGGQQIFLCVLVSS